ncbi:MAG: RNA ligase partner protein [Candidatus Omnitrophica bacterium]|jgi:RNA ligase partner protein|nr:RNA ligase partner protein [Candidatus Omnitrophota bacterium]
MKKKWLIVLDTSIFVNPDSRFLFGQTPREAFGNFLQRLENKRDVSCYIPPSVYNELIKFIEKAPAAEKMVLIELKPPSIYESPLPAILIYEFIEEMRARINKGLRVAEKYTRKGLDNNGHSEKEEDIVKNLRQEYRIALREDIIDSKEDFDLILLAKELKACLATSDKGLIKWAQKLGITCIDAIALQELINSL